MRHSFRALATLALAAAVGSACGGDGGGPNGDRTAPAVISVVPAQGATGVARTTTVTATFSEPVAATTVTAASFTVKATGTGAPVAGTLAVNGATVVFTPSAPLAFNTSYTVTIGTAITDAAGNHLATTATSSFTTLISAAPSANAGFLTGQAPTFTAPTTVSAVRFEPRTTVRREPEP